MPLLNIKQQSSHVNNTINSGSRVCNDERVIPANRQNRNHLVDMELNFRVSPLTTNSDEEVEGWSGWSVRVERALSARESLYITPKSIWLGSSQRTRSSPLWIQGPPATHLRNDQNSPANLLACHNPSYSVNKAECLLAYRAS